MISRGDRTTWENTGRHVALDGHHGHSHATNAGLRGATREADARAHGHTAPGLPNLLDRLEHASILMRAVALTIGRAIAASTDYVYQFPALATGFVRGEALSRLGAAANNLLVGAHTHQGRRPRPVRPFPPFPGFDAFAAWRIAP